MNGELNFISVTFTWKGILPKSDNCGSFSNNGDRKLVLMNSKKISIFKFLRGLMTKGMRKSSIYFMWKIVTSTGKMHLQREETIDFQQLSHGLIGCFSTRSGELKVWKGLFVYWEDFRAQASSTSFISTSFQLFQVWLGLLSPPSYQ